MMTFELLCVCVCEQWTAPMVPIMRLIYITITILAVSFKLLYRLANMGDMGSWMKLFIKVILCKAMSVRLFWFVFAFKLMVNGKTKIICALQLFVIIKIKSNENVIVSLLLLLRTHWLKLEWIEWQSNQRTNGITKDSHTSVRWIEQMNDVGS